MPTFDVNIQRQVILFGLDDSSPNAMLPNVHGGQYGASPEEWRTRVMLLIRTLLETELIVPLAGRENYREKDSEQLLAMLERGDPENGLDVDLFWDAIHFHGTPKLNNILEALRLNHWRAIDADLSTPPGEALAELGVVYL